MKIQTIENLFTVKIINGIGKEWTVLFDGNGSIDKFRDIKESVKIYMIKEFQNTQFYEEFKLQFGDGEVCYYSRGQDEILCEDFTIDQKIDFLRTDLCYDIYIDRCEFYCTKEMNSKLINGIFFSFEIDKDGKKVFNN